MTYLNGTAARGSLAPHAANQELLPRSTGQNNINAPTFVVKRATKNDAKLRLALIGPSGSGKTMTLLKLATEFGGPILLVDTEHGSASKYADLFGFDVIEMSTYDPAQLIEIIDFAGSEGYRSICIDSLSHFWMGTGGELDRVDNAAKRMQNPNSFAAWKEVTPLHNRLVDRVIGAPMHVLVSMRCKTEWVIEKDTKGKSVPRKIGLAPVMRDGIEFEFDVVGDMDQEHNLIVTKSRCPQLADQVYQRPGREVAGILSEWLGSPPLTAKPMDTATSATVTTTIVDPQLIPKPWKTTGEMRQCFDELRPKVGEVRYLEELQLTGVEAPHQFTSAAKALECYRRLYMIAAKEVA